MHFGQTGLNVNRFETGLSASVNGANEIVSSCALYHRPCDKGPVREGEGGSHTLCRCMSIYKARMSPNFSNTALTWNMDMQAKHPIKIYVHVKWNDLHNTVRMYISCVLIQLTTSHVHVALYHTYPPNLPFTCTILNLYHCKTLKRQKQLRCH